MGSCATVLRQQQQRTAVNAPRVPGTRSASFLPPLLHPFHILTAPQCRSLLRHVLIREASLLPLTLPSPHVPTPPVSPCLPGQVTSTRQGSGCTRPPQQCSACSPCSVNALHGPCTARTYAEAPGRQGRGMVPWAGEIRRCRKKEGLQWARPGVRWCLGELGLLS